METETKELLRKNTVERFFSENSSYWDSLYNEQGGPEGFTRYELKRRRETVFDLIDKIKSDKIKRVLDLGCGPGPYLPQLFSMGFDCYGADTSEEMLQIARKKLPDAFAANLIHSNCCSVPVEDDFFDLILCVGVLEYLSDDMQALRETRRLIKPSGFVIFTLPNLYKLRNILNPYYYLVRIWTYFLSAKIKSRASGAQQNEGVQFDYGKSVSTRYNLFQISKMAERSGFRVLEVRSVCFGPFSLWKNEILPAAVSIKISDFLSGLLKHKALGFLKFFTNRWVVLLQPVEQGRGDLSSAENKGDRFENNK